jgi:hypothetical protein
VLWAVNVRAPVPRGRAPGQNACSIVWARKLDSVSDLGVSRCHLAACDDHEMLLSLLYVIVRCLLGVPAVLLRVRFQK